MLTVLGLRSYLKYESPYCSLMIFFVNVRYLLQNSKQISFFNDDNDYFDPCSPSSSYTHFGVKQSLSLRVWLLLLQLMEI